MGKEENGKEAEVKAESKKKEGKEEMNQVKDENKSLQQLVTALSAADADIKAKTKATTDAEAAERTAAGAKVAASNSLKEMEKKVAARKGALEKATADLATATGKEAQVQKEFNLSM